LLVGIAGTFTTLAAVEKQLMRYSHSDVHGSCLMLGEAHRQVGLFQKKSVVERRKIVGMDPKRADVILAGAYMIERIMSFFHVDKVIVSDQGVRYGLLYEIAGPR
jgi:exopolyphosphatase/guanosine-5'-triphosphate,3'-diphosphate pyrophosphatase